MNGCISNLPTQRRIECAEQLGNQVKNIKIKDNKLYFDDIYIGPIVRFESDGQGHIIVEYDLCKGNTHVIHIHSESDI